MDEEERNKIDDGIAMYFSRFGGILLLLLLTCGRGSFVSGTQNDIVVS